MAPAAVMEMPAQGTGVYRLCARERRRTYDGNTCTTDSCDVTSGCGNTVNTGQSVALRTSGTGVGTCTTGLATWRGWCLYSKETVPVSETCDDDDPVRRIDEAFNVGVACDSGDVDSCAGGVFACDGQFSSRCVNDGEALRLNFESVVATTATPNVGWAGGNAFLQGGATTADSKTGFGQAAVLDGNNDYVQWTESTDLSGAHRGFSVSMLVDRKNTGAKQSLVHHVSSSGAGEFAVDSVQRTTSPRRLRSSQQWCVLEAGPRMDTRGCCRRCDEGPVLSRRAQDE